MCGIAGILINEKSEIKPNNFYDLFVSLLKKSESRGKEASGAAFFNEEEIKIIKDTKPASILIKSPLFKEITQNFISKKSASNFFGAIGHTRLVTNGTLGLNQNNQPVSKDGLIGVHNGIIVNDNELWQENSDLKRIYEVDTEIFLSLFRKFLNQGLSISEAAGKVFSLLEGSATIAVVFTDKKNILLTTNTGSAYFASQKGSGEIIFASEKFILKSLIVKFFNQNDWELRHLKAGTGLLIDCENMDIQEFSLNTPIKLNGTIRGESLIVKDFSQYQPLTKIAPEINYSHDYIEFCDIYEKNREIIKNIKRCSVCILPETMPFIKFDERGKCNYCRHYHKTTYFGADKLEEVFSTIRSGNDEPDCLVGFSGGRDSSYGLHLLKTEFKMNPIAYTYDWGMITDLGRRNQARVCGKLGVDHMIVSADISKKRSYIKKNVLAWLKKPELGTIPLFMAGDKQYFYYAHELKKKTGVKKIILCANPLEKTDFKTGFCGISPLFEMDEVHYELSSWGKLQLAFYYAKSYLTNPAYLNSSLVDTLFAYFSYYLLPTDYIYLFQYLPWDENQIEKILIDEYNWETAEDSNIKWRIVDGTAPLYNYIYYTAAGFTENDTFRSNQIREGFLSREQALNIVEAENAPRWESIRWYCDTIGVDFAKTIRAINSMPKLYFKR